MENREEELKGQIWDLDEFHTANDKLEEAWTEFEESGYLSAKLVEKLTTLLLEKQAQLLSTPKISQEAFNSRFRIQRSRPNNQPPKTATTHPDPPASRTAGYLDTTKFLNLKTFLMTCGRWAIFELFAYSWSLHDTSLPSLAES